MRYTWFSQILSAKRCALVLIEDVEIWTPDWYPPRVVRAPGYESSDFSDILAAELYLNTGFKGRLTESRIRILDQIKAETLEALGVTSL